MDNIKFEFWEPVSRLGVFKQSLGSDDEKQWEYLGYLSLKRDLNRDVINTARRDKEHE